MKKLSLFSDSSSEEDPSKLDRLKFWWEDLKQRWDGASKVEAVLDSVNFITKLYTIAFSLMLPVSKFALGATIDFKFFVIFVTTSMYGAIHPHLPKGKKTKWISEEANRIRMISVAEGELATLINEGNIRETDIHRVIETILRAIKSEIETIIGDDDGTCLNVSLLTEEHPVSDKLKVIARAVSTRRLRAINKDSAIVWDAMQKKRSVYEPDFALDSSAKYKTIYAFPILLEPTILSQGEMSLAGLTIDSEKKDHFRRFKEKIEIRMLPYLHLLSIALVLKIQSPRS